MIQDPVLVNDWHAVAELKELETKNPLPVRLLGEDLVLWEKDGAVLVWKDLCIHRGTKLSMGWIKDGCLVCPYHGWNYDESGQCVKIPAHPDQVPPTKAKAKTYQAKVRYGLIWVTQGEPVHDIPVFEEWEDDSYRNIPSGPYRFQAAGPRAIENFLDVAHFPFVHEGSLGDRDHPEIGDYEAVISDEGVTAEGIEIWQPNPDGTGVGSTVTYTYKVLRPMVAYFEKTKGPSFAAMYAVCPIDEKHSKGWVLMSMNYGFDTPEKEIIDFQDLVTGEDIPVVESQRPELLPLDLQDELHLRSDRTAIAYRKYLKRLGLTFGTS
ncbi:MAG: phenylpropionate dioxygenase-like ring-hydroxylating dioxygenase large terminal subunit [Cellvibrionaceae bacterium]|jgi:phenylpropionate dioxygenase-like ring-hydroxylating dioxygenase large terminal subunit